MVRDRLVDSALAARLGRKRSSSIAAGLRLLHLGVHQGNPARALYEQAGYKFAGRDGEYLLYDFLHDEA
jgi:hypothetical protein